MESFALPQSGDHQGCSSTCHFKTLSSPESLGAKQLSPKPEDKTHNEQGLASVVFAALGMTGEVGECNHPITF
jgi:hypothetical protein